MHLIYFRSRTGIYPKLNRQKLRIYRLGSVLFSVCLATVLMAFEECC